MRYLYLLYMYITYHMVDGIVDRLYDLFLPGILLLLWRGLHNLWQASPTVHHIVHVYSSKNKNNYVNNYWKKKANVILGEKSM